MKNRAAIPVLPCHCASLRKAARHLSQAYDEALAPSGLRITQFSLLAAISLTQEGEPTLRELAETMGMDRSTLGHNLRPLEREHLVSLETGRADARSRSVVLTPQGREKLNQAAPLWRAMQARFEAGYGKGPSASLRASLLRVAGMPF
ncbi:transcriptional regulator, MarR family [Verrucomicrobium sp. GAS474]|uniref:MarR family winged helix-turn-helix transcriptional regulator n=1 Tax=Verrucomicrobium sp. GAS474 TaxID=1882831 RepID=UPI00087DF00D|nr:MarR family winged helix-turn-helix transcriptional regulator [Verrucomicrobium sp. GAS474]SDT88922.1 transcriptional regulator, MarR family [Verrucomicrobium sp. GAS474]